MSRPLVVSDCDEVLLHMVRHFRDWLGEEHGVEFLLEGNPFAQSVHYSASGERVEEPELWRLLNAFFDTEMSRQTSIEGSAAAMKELQREADVVVLTNLSDHYAESRTAQLRDHGIDARVFTNQGPKGEALRRIVEEFAPTRAVFIDDLAVHHASAGEVLPDISRLHFCGEPAIAPHIPCALEQGHAHARLDTWDDALPWLLETLHGTRP
ncbi:HAD family hydrolase [Altererythrobacter salegens]|uniref:HAD family hydrolase n=1 Tax=Croceibacterium salegens TaxID=1737568 RepID=A0A6I4T1A4_9SPHN|nr:HAD family hydrolase [Croceibacterium salegens]MXO61096.1 HAD family hydrolase [Croceibacterium salegens]